MNPWKPMYPFAPPLQIFFCCIILFYVIHLHLQNYIGDLFSPNVSSSIFINIIRSIHQCWNLNPKLVSFTPVFILQIGKYLIPFAQVEQYLIRKFWITINISCHLVLDKPDRFDILNIIQWYPLWKNSFIWLINSHPQVFFFGCLFPPRLIISLSDTSIALP